jgi:uncharacterized protein (TIGR02118 family)
VIPLNPDREKFKIRRRNYMIKQVFRVKRKEGMSFEEFKKYYLEHHAPLVMKTFPEMRKYVVNMVVQRGKPTPCDAVTEICWDNLESLVKLAKSDTYNKVIRPDEERFVGSMEVILTEEFIQK